MTLRARLYDATGEDRDIELTAKEVGRIHIYLGRSAQRSNDVMKTLTIVSAIALPAIVLAGIMGMNFGLPFFDTPENFWLVMALMAVFAVGIVVIARVRRWL